MPSVYKPFLDFYKECEDTFIFIIYTSLEILNWSILKKGVNIDMDNYDNMTEEHTMI